jgi:hypothetical protein
MHPHPQCGGQFQSILEFEHLNEFDNVRSIGVRSRSPQIIHGRLLKED